MTCKPASVWRRLWPVFVSAVILALIVACNGDDPPVGPEPVEEYVVYFWDGDVPAWYYRYYPATNSVDSFKVPFETYWGYELSADGSRLYACGLDSVYVVDVTDSPIVVDHIPGRYRGGVAVSRDGPLIALSGAELQILRSSDHSLVFSDTDETHSGVFSYDSRALYAVDWNAGDHWGVYRVSLDDTTDVSRKQFLSTPGCPCSPLRVVPLQDESIWLVYQKLQTGPFDYRLELYDPLLDSVLWSQFLSPGHGDAVLTPDGRFAYVTNPGTILHGPPPPKEIYRIDLETGQLDATISTAAIPGPDGNRAVVIGRIAITPDGRWLVGNNNLGDWGIYRMNL
ncbi:hypothetical protein GF420_08715, partial [candidate division GN15 bacterium]|nr:hypothetical protein [candidate division GN15 bacterium]